MLLRKVNFCRGDIARCADGDLQTEVETTTKLLLPSFPPTHPLFNIPQTSQRAGHVSIYRILTHVAHIFLNSGINRGCNDISLFTTFPLLYLCTRKCNLQT